MKTYRLYGLDFAIVAEYPDTSQGARDANVFMALHSETGLLAAADGRIIIASLADRGTQRPDAATKCP